MVDALNRSKPPATCTDYTGAWRAARAPGEPGAKADRRRARRDRIRPRSPPRREGRGSKRGRFQDPGLRAV